MKLVTLFLFWVGMVLGMVLVRLAGQEGGLHRLWPQFFDPPASVCASSALRPNNWPELGGAEPNEPAALAHQAQVAVNFEAGQALREVA